MADFVAVIRRAVDGLATNTPETRAKVYEKARGAVQRQLENMKPRPPEEMLRRQMDKLQSAIDDVEAEHREASSAAEEVFAVPAAVPEPYPEPETQAQPEPQAEPEPYAQTYVEPQAEPEPVAHAEAEPQAPVYEEPQPASFDGGADYDRHNRFEREEATPEPASRYEPEPIAEPEHEPEAHVAPAVEPFVAPEVHEDPAPAAEAEPVSTHHAPWEANAANDRSEQDALNAFGERAEPASFAADPFAEEPADGELPYQPDHAHEQPVAQHALPELPSHGTEWHAEEAQPVAAPAAESWTWNEPEPTVKADAADAAWDDVPELIPVGPVESIDRGASADHVEAHFDQQTHVTAEAVRMPAVSDLPELAAAAHSAHSTAAADSTPAVTPVATPGVQASAAADPFAEYFDDEPVKVEAKDGRDVKDADRDPWGDLEDLIGFNNNGAASAGAVAAAPATERAVAEDDDFADLMPAPSKPYRVTPKRKHNYGGMVLGLIGLVLVGAGGYALWMNRDALTGMVDGLMQTDVKESQSSSQPTPTPSSSTASSTPAPTQPATQTPPAATSNSNTAASAVPPAADAAAASKFTQRLLPDGKEVDEGPGATGGLAQNAEGQSVAQLNAPPANPAPAAQAGAPAAPATGAAAANPSTPAPAANPADTPAVAGEKMFLYEERINQTAPTAIDGTVSWSLQREAGANGAPPEPVVQGRITIPGRGLTALMTFKRNTDPSLPASHLIEIVFAVPPDFEGGAIDSVQRIAMKQTEQDRGNALIAVPAKITDDFHMIALNDFPDARNTNLDLLRTRNWIDIPVAYRNGRRALLTLQKGAEGEKAFNEAIREWGQMPAPPTGQ